MDSLSTLLHPLFLPHRRLKFLFLLGCVRPYSNAYNWSAPLEPYTGYVEVDDFLVDIMKPQMEALFYNYDADILWCDVGGPTIFQEIGASSAFSIQEK